MESPLNIAITPNPTRQNVWRVVRVAGLLLGAWTLVSGAYRLFHQYDNVVAPDDATSLRVVRSPQTIHQLQTTAGGLQTLPGLPISLADFVSQTNRVARIWFTADEKTVVILDAAIDESTKKAWESFGVSLRIEDAYTIITSSSEPLVLDHSTLHGVWQGIRFSNEGTLGQQGESLAIEFDDSAITLHGALLQPPIVNDTATNDTIFSTALSADDLRRFSSHTVTQNTPGLATLVTLATQQGISAHIEKRGDDVSYAFAVPLDDDTTPLVTKDSLTLLAQEIVEIPTIQSLTAFLDDGTRTRVIRSREEATTVVREEAPYYFITATTADGTAYITQTPSLLTISNHASTIPTASTPNACLPGAVAFVRPSALRELLFTSVSYRSMTLADLLWRSQTVASSSRLTRICFDK
ncbi:MAG: hypothetical protein AAB839_01600 [Patescibacteria group bacterium]